MPSWQEVMEKLNLKPLPEEGGFYKETFRSPSPRVPAKAFGISKEGDRDVSTAIYYLITEDIFSALHRITSDEVFHFYAGDPVEMIQFDEAGKLSRYIMGSQFMKGEHPQVVVPRNVWQALRMKEGGQWALLGTTVAPGFEFEDFEVGQRDQLLQSFPQLKEDILRFTRPH